jgi:hypothetical protein
MTICNSVEEFGEGLVTVGKAISKAYYYIAAISCTYPE